MSVRLTFLGTGTSNGVPFIACNCPVCTSQDPRDKRLRASVLVEWDGINIVVDAGPDFRQQMLRANVQHLDAILLTHNHKDHTGGLDDTRGFNLAEKKPVNIYCEKYVEETLRREFAYAFAEPRYPGSPEWHLHTIDGKNPFLVHSNEGEATLRWESGVGYHYEKPQGPESLKPVEVVPIQGWHLKDRTISVLGFRFGPIAYLTDMNYIEDSEIEKLKGVEVVTVNCVKVAPHRSHFSLAEALAFFEKVGARRSYITHLSHLLPCHEEFAKMLPPGVFPAYDGLTIDL